MSKERKLIDANGAYEAVVDLSGQAATKSAYAAFWRAGKTVLNLPAVDAVEVVRCKECASFEETCPGHGYCYYWDYEQGMSPNQVESDDFCSYGERRSDNGNS